MEIIPVSVCRILEPSSHHGPIAGKPEPGRAFLALARIRIVDIGPFTGIGTPAAGKDPPSRAILYPYACDASFGSLYVCRLFPPGGDPRRSAARRVASGAAGARWTVCPVLHFEIQDHCDLLLLIPGAHNSRCSFLCRIRIFLHGLLDPSGIHCRRYQPVPADGQKLSVSLPLQLRPVLLRFPLRSLGIQNCRHLLASGSSPCEHRIRAAAGLCKHHIKFQPFPVCLDLLRQYLCLIHRHKRHLCPAGSRLPVSQGIIRRDGHKGRPLPFPAPSGIRICLVDRVIRCHDIPDPSGVLHSFHSGIFIILLRISLSVASGVHPDHIFIVHRPGNIPFIKMIRRKNGAQCLWAGDRYCIHRSFSVACQRPCDRKEKILPV